MGNEYDCTGKRKKMLTLESRKVAFRSEKLEGDLGGKRTGELEQLGAAILLWGWLRFCIGVLGYSRNAAGEMGLGFGNKIHRGKWGRRGRWEFF